MARAGRAGGANGLRLSPPPTRSSPSTRLAVVAAARSSASPGCSREPALAIDLRPSTGQIYLLGSTSRLYVVNPADGVVTAVGVAFSPALSGTTFGFDFDPVDRIRVVSDTGQNLRLNPDTGAVVAVDTASTPARRIVGFGLREQLRGSDDHDALRDRLDD